MKGSNLLTVNGPRLWDTLQQSGEIGPGRAGGENEHIELEYTLPAVNVLMHTVLARADRP